MSKPSKPNTKDEKKTDFLNSRIYKKSIFFQVSSRSLKAEPEMDDLPPIITQPLLPNKNDRDFEPLSGIMVKGPCQWEIQTSYNPTRIPTQITEVICTGTGTSCEQNHPMYQVKRVFSNDSINFLKLIILPNINWIIIFFHLVYTNVISNGGCLHFS